MGVVHMVRHVEIDAQSFPEVFARRSIPVSHSLSDHPLFTMTRSPNSPTGCRQSVRRERATAARKLGLGYVDVGTGPPSETSQDVERSGVRISLRDIQQAPEYAELINECLDEVAELVADREGGMTQTSRLPVHLLSGLDNADALRRRAQLPASGEGHQARECRHVRGRPRHAPSRARSLYRRRGVRLRGDAKAAETTRLEPGVGVYLPSFVPHWVETEAGVSVSFRSRSSPRTPSAQRASRRINKRLRRLHLSLGRLASRSASTRRRWPSPILAEAAGHPQEDAGLAVCNGCACRLTIEQTTSN